MSQELSKKLVEAITFGFNDGLKELIISVHGIMPNDSIVLNVITSLSVARKQCGFTDDQTRDEIVKAVNQIGVWNAGIEKGKTSG